MIEPQSRPHDIPTALPYATPGAQSGSPTAAAAVIAFVGLGLIVLGGCFLIPLAEPFFDPRDVFPMSGHVVIVGLVLFLLAFTCFGFAAWLLFIAIRRLLRVMRG
jgi:hypothetical protein